MGEGGSLSIDDLTDGDRVAVLENQALWPALVKNGHYTYDDPTGGPIRVYFTVNASLTLPEPSSLSLTSTGGRTIFVLADGDVTVDLKAAAGATIIGSCVLEEEGESMALVVDGPSSWRILSCNKASSGGEGVWGSITGTLSNQTDLQNALDAKASQSALADSAAAIRADFPAGGSGSLPQPLGTSDSPSFAQVTATTFSAYNAFFTLRGRALVLVDSLASADVRTKLGVGEIAKIISRDSLALNLGGGDVFRIALDKHGQLDTTPPTITNFVCVEVGANVECSWDSDEVLVVVDGDTDGVPDEPGPSWLIEDLLVDDGTYTMVHEAPAPGTWQYWLLVAQDAAGNDGADSGTHNDEVVIAAPVASNLSCEQAGADVTCSFESTKALSMIQLEGITSGDGVQLDEEDFTESGSGPYTYTALHESPVPGEWLYELTGIADLAGRSGNSDLSDVVEVTEPSAGMTDQLIAYWDLEEASGNDRVDEVNGYTLVETGTAVGTRAGVIGNAADFALDTGTLVAAANDRWSAGQSFSVSYWYVRDSGSASLTYPITSKAGPSGAPTSSEWRMWTGNSQPYFFIGGTNLTNESASQSTGAWTHYVLTYDVGTDEAVMYQNGTAVRTQTVGTTSIASKPLALGTGYSTGTSELLAIDEVGYWHRVLTATEVACLYNSGSGVAYANLSTCDE